MNPEANGRAFLGLAKYIKDTAGPQRLREIVEGAGSETREVFSNRILAVSWYTYSSFSAFLKSIQKTMGKGDRRYCTKLGEVTGQKDLETIFRIYKNISDPEQLIRACSNVWESYYRNAGKMEAVRWEPLDTIVQITGFKEMARNHCLLMLGWMSRTLQEVGLEVLRCEETRCMSRGDLCHEFFYQWKKITEE